MGTIAWGFSLAVLLDCRFVYSDFTHSVVTTHQTTDGSTGMTAAAATIATTDVRFNFGLFQYEDVNITRTTTGTFASRNPAVATVDAAFDAAFLLDNNVTIRSSGNRCTPYPPGYAISPGFKAARACAMVAVIVGAWMTCLLWFGFCCPFLFLCFSDAFIIFSFLVLLPVVQGLTMMFYSSVCNYKLSEEPLAFLLFDKAMGQNETATLLNIWNDPTRTTLTSSDCGIAGRGAFYPISIVLWILCGLLFLVIKPKSSDHLNFFSQNTLLR